jgi:chromate transport protein ChrA
VLGSLLGAVSSLDASRAARRFRRALIDYAFAGVAFVIGLGFLVAAAFIWAADRYGSFPAALGFGAGFIALAAVIMMVHRILVARRARRRREEERADQLRSIATAAAVAAVPALVRQAGLFGTLLLPIAAAAAYAIIRENTRPDPGDEPPL